MATVSFRLKIILVFVFVVAGAAGYYKFHWLPRAERISEQALTTSVEGHLASVANGLVAPLIQNQLGNIHEQLDTLLADNPDWVAVVLYDRSGRRLFPFGNLEKTAAGSTHTFERAIYSHDGLLGKISVTVDFKPRTTQMEQIHNGLALSLGGGFGMFMLLLAVLVDATVRRPTEKLARAANRLAHGDFEATLPAVRRDEIGLLIASFATMRDQIRSDREELSRARDDLEVRVQERTVELHAINEELMESEEKFRGAFDNAGVGIFIRSTDGKSREYNRTFCDILGYSAEELQSMRLRDLAHPDDDPETTSIRNISFDDKDSRVVERRFIRKDGKTTWGNVSYRTVHDAGGKPLSTIAMYQDITEKKESEREAAEKSALLDTTIDTMAQGIAVYDDERQIIHYNEHFAELLNLPPELLHPGLSMEEIIRCRAKRGDYGDGDVEKIVKDRFERAKFSGERVEERTLPDGTTYIYDRRLMPGGRCLITYTDITERKEAERALEEREKHLSGIMQNAADGIITIGERGIIETFNQAAELMFGYPSEHVRGRNVSMLMPEPNHRQHDGYIENYLKTGKGRIIGIGPREVTAQRKDGSTFPMSIVVSAMEIEGERKFIGIVRDITKQRETDQQLQQSQKMDAIGQLTGGVAHDFNNLLTAIIGNIQLLERSLPDDAKAKRQLESALRASFRGADLTKRLLAFSRKEALSSEITDLNALLPDTIRLLERTLGEHIEIKTVLTDGLWQALIDQSQMETSLLNLAVNARDAMPEGGRLTIETANTDLDEVYADRYDEVTPGPYVMVAVSDIGSGMSPETMEHVFEPFFTTKEVGKGTGLGLSMVFGFVKQSGGHVTIYSEEGVGTTMKLYFPKATATGEALEGKQETPSAMPMGSETILVVEDDADVRAFVVSALEIIGHTVLEAEDGPTALRLLEDRPHIDLLLTDVVMPGGMSGMDVAKELRKLYPGIKVLYTSGYPGGAIDHHGRLDDGVELLRKPYTRETLTQRVRQVLDATSGSNRVASQR